MAAVTTAVVATAVAVKGQQDAKKAQKKAADSQEAAAIQSAKVLGKAGVEGEREILNAQKKAARDIGRGAKEAEARITPFVEPGIAAFEQAQEQILSGLPISGPLADSIRTASTQAILDRPEIFNVSGPVGQEVRRQADLTVSGVTPAFTQNLLTAGQQGISAVGDVSGIRQRGLENLADIAGSTAAQRASALVGQTPALQTLSQGATEARLLGDVAGQQAQTGITETLAGLGGTLSAQFGPGRIG